MSRQSDREEFLFSMSGLGVSIRDARTILRHAATIQRCNEASCSYEWADRDRVECPGAKDRKPGQPYDSRRPDNCICDYGYSTPGQHETVQRVERTAQRREISIRAILTPYGLEPVFQGDPRGWCLRILRPTDRRGEAYSDGIGVPA